MGLRTVSHEEMVQESENFYTDSDQDWMNIFIYVVIVCVLLFRIWELYMEWKTSPVCEKKKGLPTKFKTLEEPLLLPQEGVL